MNQRFRKAALTAAMAVTVTLFSDAAWAKKRVHAEPAAKPIAAAQSKSKCQANFKEEISKRLANPKKADEFISIVSERSIHYTRSLVPMETEVDQYLKEDLISKYKEEALLKKAKRIERSYLDSIGDDIVNAASSRPENGNELLSLLRDCNFVEVRSIVSAVKRRISLGAQRPEQYSPEKDPRYWRVVTPERIPSKTETESNKKQSEIDVLFGSGKEEAKETNFFGRH